MSIRIFHQVGHNSNWNIESLIEDKCGDGLILSPVHQKFESVKSLKLAVRKRSLFDPQYYLPNSPKAKLATYPFFPEQITDGFSTIDFLQVAHESANQCVSFQRDQEFEGIVIPSRFIDQMASKYFENQEKFTVRPFLKAIAQLGVTTPVYLTVPVTSAMLEDDGFQTKLLNWITGFSEIAGVYILVSDIRPSKQIKSASLLFAYLRFAQELTNAGMTLVLGHLNTESVLFSLVEGAALTFGSFENTRIFSVDKFIESDEIRLGPKARIYLPTLLNWIQYGHALQIRDADDDIWAGVYSETKYSRQVLSAAAEPHFSQPDLYKDHFLRLHNQLKKLGSLPLVKRFEAVKQQIQEAQDFHSQIAEIPVDLDPHGNGEHLSGWLDAANRFYRSYLRG